MLYHLDNPIQNYAWGSKTSLTDLFGIANPNGEPQAEIWMGAHPNGCSTVRDHEESFSLRELIDASPESVLGTRMLNTFGADLPYLLKFLAAAEPLSIQVHPEKSKAVAGFERENTLGIALSAANRNYKDANHKPELVYALTPYLAMNAFRPFAEIVILFEQANCAGLAEQVSALKANESSEQLKTFFEFILSREGEEKATLVTQLLDNIDSKGCDANSRLAFDTVKMLSGFYSGDIGLFSPLFLHVIELQPGQAMFLDAETPHAYLRGTGVEIMANSDNVLRAGLTPKHMDVAELVANTRFEPVAFDALLTAPVVDGAVQCFPVPVADFNIEVITLTEGYEHRQAVDGAEILLCIEGEAYVNSVEQHRHITASESLFVTAAADHYTIKGEGKVVHISA